MTSKWFRLPAAARASITITMLATATLAATQDRAAAPTSEGAVRLEGIVSDERAQPVPGAIVTLTGSALHAGRASITDALGRFAFDRLPPGQVTLTASKPAYLTSSYGALRPGGAGSPITLGTTEQHVLVTMPRGAAVSGSIRDARGDPMPGIDVYAVRAGQSSAAASRNEAFVTDDRGAYRIYGLAPGEYYVVATQRRSAGLGEVGMMSSGEVDAALAALERRAPRGGVPPGTERFPSSIVRPAATFSPVPVFHPGVTSAAAAVPVRVGLGEDRGGVDVAYQLARTAAVSGTISGAGSQDVQISLNERTMVRLPLSFGAGPRLERRAGGDGAFTFTNVTPGTYSVLVRTAVPGARGRGAAPSTGAAPVLYALATVTVDGDDVEGLGMTLQPAPRVHGRVTADGGPLPAELSKVVVTLAEATGGNVRSSLLSAVGLSTPGPARGAPIRPDGTFEIEGMLPGAYRVTLRGHPASWRPRAARIGDVDVLDVPLEIGDDDVSGLEIALTDRHTQISGRLLQASGAPASGYFVVAFTADRTLWIPGGRRLRAVRPSTDGRFAIDDLPAGEYYLAALTDAESEDWQTPEFLAQAMASAVTVTLADGERKTQDLQIAR